MGLSCAHHLKKLIKDNHAIELKYIQWHWRSERPVNWETQVIEYAHNGEILPAIQQYLSEPYAQPIQGRISNDATIPSTGALSLPQPQASNAQQDQEHKSEIDNKAPGLPISLDPRLHGVEESDQVKPRRRPSGSLNKTKPTRKEQKVQQSTQQDLLRFEHVNNQFNKRPNSLSDSPKHQTKTAPRKKQKT